MNNGRHGWFFYKLSGMAQRQDYRKRNLIRDGGLFSDGIHIKKKSLLKNIFKGNGGVLSKNEHGKDLLCFLQNRA
jgi:hypothetical protein